MLKDNKLNDKDVIHNRILILEELLLDANEEDREIHHKTLHELRMRLND